MLVLAWLLAPLGWQRALPWWLAGALDIASGNIYILLAAAAVLSFRKPEWWAFAGLTKISLTLGPVWYLARGEWQALMRSVAAILVIGGTSFVLVPDLWVQWGEFLMLHLDKAGGALGPTLVPPAVVRIPAGILVVAWGARTGRAWTIPVAMVVCTPVLAVGSLTLLAALPRLNRLEDVSSPQRARHATRR